MHKTTRNIGILFITIGLSPIWIGMLAGVGLIIVFVSMFFGGMNDCGIICKIGQGMLYPVSFSKLFTIEQILIGMVVFTVAGVICLFVYSNQRKKLGAVTQSQSGIIQQ